MKAIALVALALLLAGCSSGGSGSGTVPDQDEEGNYVIHATSGNRFDPMAAKVPVGANVTWVIDGGVHDVTGTSGNAHHIHSARTMPKGQEYTVRFDEAGTYEYECELHASSGMKGTVIVE